MSVKRKVFSFILLLFILISPIISQESDVKFGYSELLLKYQTLLAEHEATLTDYDELLTDYEELLNKYDSLKLDFDSLKVSFIKLNDEHAIDAQIYKGTKLSLEAATVTIISLEKSVTQLLSISDNNYFALYPQVGYTGTLITGGLGLTAQIPKFPISILIDLDYIHGLEIPINIQVGIGIRF